MQLIQSGAFAGNGGGKTQIKEFINV